jgi:hypothetical protein
VSGSEGLAAAAGGLTTRVSLCLSRRHDRADRRAVG